MYIIHERATVFSNIAQKLDYSRDTVRNSKISLLVLTFLKYSYN